MPSESTTAFLQNVLSGHNETKHSQPADEEQLEKMLVNLGENNPDLFLSICEELIYLIIEHLNKIPAPDLPNSTLGTIAKDLTAVINPLWKLGRYRQLEKFVTKARNNASYASKTSFSTRRNNLVESCNNSLKDAFSYLKGI